MGLLAMGRMALGFSSGLAVKVGKLDPGPQRIRACSPGAAIETACGILQICDCKAGDVVLVGEGVSVDVLVNWNQI